ncbi:HAD-IIB family hydrolase [Spiroplasma taiwanense]|uniref:HAD family hydrolase n=1 Tax=Spiroplasma taiwanense CT-1 TaxID=1276220 RepID=S5LX02_9MOLU|nr:HAD-IIB family hydrolase [Spiroplasma taiwanense]AGR41166.1 HAD family hydrolase [Spiroplasma taiwanense CT-1]
MEINKIAATDLDGTIIFERDRISDGNKELLLKFQQKTNNKLTIVTGRSYFLTDFAAKELNVKLPVICSNGVSVINPETFEYIAKNHFTEKEILNLMKLFIQEKIDFSIANDFTTHFVKGIGWHSEFFSNENLFNFHKLPVDRVFHEYNSIEELSQECVKTDSTFVSIVLECNSEEKLQRARILGKELELELLEFKYHNGEIGRRIEVYKKNSSKSWGLNALANYLNITKNDIFIFGDEHNDYAMFEDFPNSFAVGNAIEGIKELASEVIDTVYNCGVGKKLNEIINNFI